jgi:uncharacterized DUF497 family protein
MGRRDFLSLKKTLFENLSSPIPKHGQRKLIFYQLDKLRKCIYHYVVGTVISPDGHFEWDEDKNILNKEDHGFFFEDILDAFNDPFFLEAYDYDNSTTDETRWKGIASFDQRIYFFLSYTEQDNRTRIISARKAEPLERERYDENYRNQVAGYE